MKRQFGWSWLSAGLLCVAAGSASAQTEIQWWHAMTGANNDLIVKLANDFNGAQKDYKVVPSYKGRYTDTMNDGIAALLTCQATHKLQVFEVGNAISIDVNGAD